MRRPSAGYAFPQFMKQRAATRAAPSPPWGSPTPTHITLRQYADWARKSPLWWLPDGRWISGMDHPFVAGPCLLMRVRDRGRSSHCDLLGRLCLSRTITYSQRPGRLTLPALPSGMFKWEGCADPALSARLRRGSSAALRSALRPLTLGARAWDDVEMDHMKRSALTRVSWWRGAPQGTPPADPPPTTQLPRRLCCAIHAIPASGGRRGSSSRKCGFHCGLGGASWQARACQRRPFPIETWLILPVVICLSQRLSHACISLT